MEVITSSLQRPERQQPERRPVQQQRRQQPERRPVQQQRRQRPERREQQPEPVPEQQLLPSCRKRTGQR